MFDSDKLQRMALRPSLSDRYLDALTSRLRIALWKFNPALTVTYVSTSFRSILGEFLFTLCFDHHVQSVHQICNVLISNVFRGCMTRLSPKVYYQMCLRNLCLGNFEAREHLLCGIVSEYARQCSLNYGTPSDWRSVTNCGKMVLKQCLYESPLVNKSC